MRLRARKWKYLCKPIGEIHSIYLMRGGMKYAIAHVGRAVFEDFRNRNPKLVGMPIMATVFSGKEIAVQPTPDEGYTMMVRYFPPMEEQ